MFRRTVIFPSPSSDSSPREGDYYRRTFSEKVCRFMSFLMVAGPRRLYSSHLLVQQVETEGATASNLHVFYSVIFVHLLYCSPLCCQSTLSGAVARPSQFPFLVTCLIHQAITLQHLGRVEQKIFQREYSGFQILHSQFLFCQSTY